ncbi:hypothetical protein [Chelativorans sp. M5D2P16]|uniref:hypothetical protein n=1 Tax=Chelativorans sp. M5D2P16 TaxID=3095678 RepID=UPI002ACA4011|nr:hypothetical protein [Chelativorans sp. M5D2P16]MDZ5699829.1 hypothetical protein [Chelativorans sp. M5D2P16]
MTGSIGNFPPAKLRRGFVDNWISGAAESRSLRRRLMAVLRMAHSVLGMRRGRLGLGTLGIGGSIAAVALGMSATSALAGYAAGNGQLTGTGQGAVSIGTGPLCHTFVADYSTGIGCTVTVSGLSGVGMGMNTVVSGDHAVGIGRNVTASGNHAIGMGISAKSEGRCLHRVWFGFRRECRFRGRSGAPGAVPGPQRRGAWLVSDSH